MARNAAMSSGMRRVARPQVAPDGLKSHDVIDALSRSSGRMKDLPVGQNISSEVWIA